MVLCLLITPSHEIYLLLGRSLMIGWRKNSWNPERVPTVVTFVCVCNRATEHTFWPRNLIFGWSVFFIYMSYRLSFDSVLFLKHIWWNCGNRGHESLVRTVCWYFSRKKQYRGICVVVRIRLPTQHCQSALMMVGLLFVISWITLSVYTCLYTIHID